MLKIEKKISAFEVVKNGETAAENAQLAMPNINPLDSRIERRPDGELDATSSKFEYSTQEGKKKIYLTISFMPFTGMHNGEQITCERPIEFFLPAGQSSEDHQWISATMRSISLAARAGFVAKALQDLRSVAWTKGPVRCGTVDYGNNKIVPVIHDSEVAAIAWAIQQSLYRRGFLDADGNQVPPAVNARRYKRRLGELAEQFEAVATETIKVKSDDQASTIKGTECPKCRQFSVIKESGCEQCTSCDYNKCS
jgi:ribonucleoside-diphosphate reductase alpha chain